VIGGGDWGEDRLVPDAMRAALANDTVRVRNPNAIRPWQHVINPLSGYLVLAQAIWDSPEHAGGWNFGPTEDEARPVGWLIERLAELWPERVRWAVDDGPHPHEAHYLKLDSSLARSRLGWRPMASLDMALAETAAWYREFEAGADMRALTLAQLERFGAV
jgi:CDP-glucose 4,6-dehydratase